MTARKARADELGLMAQWNDVAADYPRDRSLADLFEDWAASQPSAIALTQGDRTLTYAELNARTNRVAHHLVRLGVVPGATVACCLERSPELIIALLGIVKAGAAYVPLDPSFPAERVAMMVGDAGVTAFITSPRVAERGLAAPCVPTLLLDAAETAVAAESADNLAHRPRADDLAYVMFTSGSTGQPKGVEIPHRGIVRLVRNTNYGTFGPGEVTLQFSTVAFDAATYEIWGALLNGGRLVLMPAEEPSLAELGRVIREQGVTQMLLATGLFHVMVEQRLEDLGRLRQIFTGGDVISPWHARQVVEKCPGTRLTSLYGPTEGTVCVTYEALPHGCEVREPVPIGRTITNNRLYIVGSDLERVGIGETGELCIAGDGLARGYRNRPELTAERFVTHTFADGTTERLYRTGDQARFLPDGRIDFLGRNDNQVKLRGFRIELSEVEVALQKLPGVRQACVIAEREDGRAKRLVAYCTPTEGVQLVEATLKTALRQAVPPFMVPAAFVFLDSFPVTQIGKIDRARLPKPEAERPVRVEMPAGELEGVIAQAWRRALRLDHVGRDDNFFDLGGDSIVLMNAHAHLETALGVAIPVLDMFEHTTIRALAQKLGGGAQASSQLLADAERAKLQRAAFARQRGRRMPTPS